MKINVSKATFSSIVGIGQKVKKAARESGEKYLELNRGVNAVTGIDLTEIMGLIDFNSTEFQTYAPNLGIESLRKSIVKEYFPSYINTENFHNNISITPGGMPALDLVLQTLNVENIYFPQFYWGSYTKMATIRQKTFSFYQNLSDLDLSKVNDSTCIWICDPSNPTGIKLSDEELLYTIHKINESGAIIIFDSPYRKLFYDDEFFDKLAHYKNVIITESFSKWVGLSGLRLGFIYSSNKEFNDELNIRLLYQFNAVSTASQLIINKLLSTDIGRESIKNFKETTTEHIKRNIDFLHEKNLLVKELYGDVIPKGIFAVINKSEDYLFQHKIGAVGMDKFVYYEKDEWSSYSRICVSVDHEVFKEFINNL